MEEIKVNSKKKKSNKGKIALSAVGIFLASVFLFGASFILSLGYIINPTPIVFGLGSDLEKENKELKEEIEALENQIERLEASVEKYKNSYSVPSVSEPETSTDTTLEETTTASSSSSTGQSLHSQKQEEAEKKTEDKKTETKKEDTSSKFEAETTVTPENDTELTEPASEDITVVEID